MKAGLEIEKLSVGYKRRPLIADFSAKLKEGTTTALIGRNGAGKTTLIKTLTRQLNPLKGQIWLDRRELSSYSRNELSKLMAVVTTEQNMAGGLRLKEFVEMGRIPFTGRFGRLSEEDREVVEQALKSVDLIHKQESFVSELSDGERQKGMLARALVQQTPLIIMDEPFSFLDIATRLEMNVLIRKLAHENNKTILYSTHEVGEALRMADEIWILTKNNMVAGPPQKLIDKGHIDQLLADTQVVFDRKTHEFRIEEKGN